MEETVMKTTVLFWEAGEGKTEQIINIVHESQRTSQEKLIITTNGTEIEVLKHNYNIPLKTNIVTFGMLKNGKTRGMKPDLILIDNAECLDNKLFESEVKPLLATAKELIITGRSIEVFKHYRQPEDLRFIRNAKEALFKIEATLNLLRRSND